MTLINRTMIAVAIAAVALIGTLGFTGGTAEARCRGTGEPSSCVQNSTGPSQAFYPAGVSTTGGNVSRR